MSTPVPVRYIYDPWLFWWHRRRRGHNYVREYYEVPAGFSYAMGYSGEATVVRARCGACNPPARFLRGFER